MSNKAPFWDHIKEIWLTGNEELSIVAEQYGVTVPEIFLMATKEQWGDRGTDRPICPSLDVAVLDDKQVILAHKTDLGRLRLVAAAILEASQFETDAGKLLKTLERLAKVYNIVIPLERKVFGIGVETDDAPDSVTINVGGKSV